MAGVGKRCVWLIKMMGSLLYILALKCVKGSKVGDTWWTFEFYSWRSNKILDRDIDLRIMVILVIEVICPFHQCSCQNILIVYSPVILYYHSQNMSSTSLLLCSFAYVFSYFKISLLSHLSCKVHFFFLDIVLPSYKLFLPLSNDDSSF